MSGAVASCVYEGWVRHRRFAPIAHDFRYRLAMLYLDLAELPELFEDRWLWSARGPALAWFRRADHLGDPREPLDEAVRALVAARTGERPRGPVRLLTHLRYLGYCFNPVSLYYCYEADGERLAAIVAEVSKTPWGERHAYVLDRRRDLGTGRSLRFRFTKDFHVSPFMAMDQLHDWRFTRPGRQLVVHMENVERGATLFDATVRLGRRPLTTGSLARVLTRYPLMTGQVIAAIYRQALRLWLGGTPFYPHPSRAVEN